MNGPTGRLDAEMSRSVMAGFNAGRTAPFERSRDEDVGGTLLESE